MPKRIRRLDRLRSTTALTCLPAHAPGKPGLCECEACCPVTSTQPIDPQADTSREALFAWMDKNLPRAQWPYADAMLYAAFPISRDYAVEVAKDWLKRKVLGSHTINGVGAKMFIARGPHGPRHRVT